MPDKNLFFTQQLLAWASRHVRLMPWKGERDPYKIWLSEIILQQTRVEQGRPYFERFAARFPTVNELAAAPEEEVLKLWEGLGYYSRARNLHATAKYISEQLGGNFPASFEALRALKGVGDYTAAAIASFAYGLPHAVLDGNVYRVLARYFGLGIPINTPAAKRSFTELAQSLLDIERPGTYNQAVMDFGATHCTPLAPKCGSCPMQTQCSAYLENRVQELPVKTKAAPKKLRVFLYGVFNYGEYVFLKQRKERDIWEGLYDFPLLELPSLPLGREETLELLNPWFFPEGRPAEVEFSSLSPPLRQTLSHQVIAAVFVEFSIKNGISTRFFEQFPLAECIKTTRYNIKKNIALPRLIDKYLNEKSLTLSLL